MKLVHFSDKKKLVNKKYKKYVDRDTRISGKPHGLWVSDEDDFGWKEWCEGEKFRLEKLKHAHEVVLKKDSNILYIRNEEGLDAFNEKYGIMPVALLKIIDWNRLIHEGYQGIVITPYLWERRLDHNVFWYYGWDCASGCIWDMSAIEEIKLI